MLRLFRTPSRTAQGGQYEPIPYAGLPRYVFLSTMADVGDGSAEPAEALAAFGLSEPEVQVTLSADAHPAGDSDLTARRIAHAHTDAYVIVRCRPLIPPVDASQRPPSDGGRAPAWGG